jgi:hypothetical protein
MAVTVFCKDCKHVRNTTRLDENTGQVIKVAAAWWQCGVQTKINPVDATESLADCGFMRTFGGGCGPEGKLFEAAAGTDA